MEELPAIELSRVHLSMNGEVLDKAIILNRNWCWVTSQKSNHEKLAEFIDQLPWMDSRLLLILSALGNQSRFCGELLFQAAHYAFWRNDDYKVFRNTFSRDVDAVVWNGQSVPLTGIICILITRMCNTRSCVLTWYNFF